MDRRWVGGWGPRYLVSNVDSWGLQGCWGRRVVHSALRPGTMKEHGYVTLPSLLGDLDVSTDAAWSTGHSAVGSDSFWYRQRMFEALLTGWVQWFSCEEQDKTTPGYPARTQRECSCGRTQQMETLDQCFG